MSESVVLDVSWPSICGVGEGLQSLRPLAASRLEIKAGLDRWPACTLIWATRPSGSDCLHPCGYGINLRQLHSHLTLTNVVTRIALSIGATKAPSPDICATAHHRILLRFTTPHRARRKEESSKSLTKSEDATH
jgi:hypothetical protein